MHHSAEKLWFLAIFRYFQPLITRKRPNRFIRNPSSARQSSSGTHLRFWGSCLPAIKVYASFSLKGVVFGNFSVFSTPYNSKTAQPIYQQLKLRSKVMQRNPPTNFGAFAYLPKKFMHDLAKKGGFWRFFGIFNPYKSKTAQRIYQQLRLR